MEYRIQAESWLRIFRLKAVLHAQQNDRRMRQMKDEQVSSTSAAGCRFCQLINREVPGAIVFEDEVTLAFLDHRPLFPGHCLLVPKYHYQTLTDLPAELVAPLFTNARLLAIAVEEAMDAEGTFVAMNNRVSQSVPHIHIHIVPRRRKDGLRGFFWPRQKYNNELEVTEVQRAIKTIVERLQKLNTEDWHAEQSN